MKKIRGHLLLQGHFSSVTLKKVSLYKGWCNCSIIVKTLAKFERLSRKNELLEVGKNIGETFCKFLFENIPGCNHLSIFNSPAE